MECKFNFSSLRAFAAFRNNRNILECKYELNLNTEELINEIIETYWNVNPLPFSQSNYYVSEIIETYWNVNKRQKDGKSTRKQK